MNALKNTVHLPIFAWEQIFSSWDRDCYSGSGIRIVNSGGIRKSVTLGLRSFAPRYIDFFFYMLYISIFYFWHFHPALDISCASENKTITR